MGVCGGHYVCDRPEYSRGGWSSQLEMPRGKGAAQRPLMCTERSGESPVEQQQCCSRQQGSRRPPNSWKKRGVLSNIVCALAVISFSMMSRVRLVVSN